MSSKQRLITRSLAHVMARDGITQADVDAMEVDSLEGQKLLVKITSRYHTEKLKDSWVYVLIELALDYLGQTPKRTGAAVAIGTLGWLLAMGVAVEVWL